MSRYAFMYPLLAILFWAGNVVVSKMASHAISPVAITFYRLVLALTVMSTFVLIPAWKNRQMIIRYWKQLAVGGFLSVSLFQWLSYQAASTTTATNMAVVTALIPLLTLLISTWILKEVLSYGMVLGGILSLIGIAYLLSHGQISTLFAGGVYAGDGLMLIAATGYALYSVLLKYWKMPVPAWQSTYVQAIFALIYVFPFFVGLQNSERQLNMQTVPLIVYAGIFSSVLLSYLWIEGVRCLGPSKNSIFMNLLPLFTALIAVMMLGEQLEFYHLAGGGLTLAGILMAQLLNKPLKTGQLQSS
ncbi:DMT family transporter [Acinetobacter sp. WCHAc010052]|uniref:DMT family transporter n=1 Tax=Acinetobacter sp. WCHAc010052 TaxID=2004647 RepID=UPI000B3CA734|nr:DMT family transporter [Acinetobacter sp. WCHAc010052]AXY59051.1 DMT family transporter [Acinetobacter sp. WCHAc010052]